MTFINWQYNIYFEEKIVKAEKIEKVSSHGSGNVDGEDALQALEDFQSYLRNLIKTNPNTKINDLIIDYTP